MNIYCICSNMGKSKLEKISWRKWKVEKEVYKPEHIFDSQELSNYISILSACYDTTFHEFMFLSTRVTSVMLSIHGIDSRGLSLLVCWQFVSLMSLNHPGENTFFLRYGWEGYTCTGRATIVERKSSQQEVKYFKRFVGIQKNLHMFSGSSLVSLDICVYWDYIWSPQLGRECMSWALHVPSGWPQVSWSLEESGRFGDIALDFTTDCLLCPHLATYAIVEIQVLISQSCLILCDPIDYSSPGSSVHWILQARILEWVTMPFSRVSSQLRDQSRVSCIAGRLFIIWVTVEIQRCF